MRSRVAATSALAVAALAAAPPAHAELVATLGGARAVLATCHRDTEQGDRFMTVVATMRTQPGAERLGIRFDLLQKLPSDRYRHLKAPGLGVWNLSDAGRPAYRYVKRIENLAAPASYRAVVRFRWYDDRGRTLRQVRRVTHSCRQPDYRPDLRLRAPQIDAPQGDTQRYEVGVVNTGRTVATNFDVLLAVSGLLQPVQAVQQLEPGERRRLRFVGPRCRLGSLVSFTVDPDNRVDEHAEDNDSVSVTCPSPS
jgi:hypothetical protein